MSALHATGSFLSLSMPPQRGKIRNCVRLWDWSGNRALNALRNRERIDILLRYVTSFSFPSPFNPRLFRAINTARHRTMVFPPFNRVGAKQPDSPWTGSAVNQIRGKKKESGRRCLPTPRRRDVGETVARWEPWTWNRSPPRNEVTKARDSRQRYFSYAPVALKWPLCVSHNRVNEWLARSLDTRDVTLRLVTVNRARAHTQGITSKADPLSTGKIVSING